MKAVQLLAYGDAVEGLALRDIEEPPVPGLGEALVQVRFAPINVNDLMVAWGVKDAVAHAVRGGKVLLAFGDAG